MREDGGLDWGTKQFAGSRRPMPQDFTGKSTRHYAPGYKSKIIPPFPAPPGACPAIASERRRKRSERIGQIFK